MLNLDNEFLANLLDKIKQFQAKDAVSFPEITDDMDALYVLEDHPDDAVYEETLAIVNNLRPDQQTTLVALTYFGQDDFEGNSWDETLKLAQEEPPENTGEYLLAIPLASEYIAEALQKLDSSFEQ